MTVAAGLVADLVVHRDDGFALDVAIRAPRGHTTALLGPNGAGKSTAIAAISGLLPLDGGRITLDGNVLDDPDSGRFVPAEQRHLGVVFQDRMLFGHLSVVENVAFGLRSRGIARAEARSAARDWLRRVGLDDLGDRRPSDLSGGQAQRVALCRALATDPAALLLDEPLAALDVQARVETRRVLKQHLDAFPGPRVVITHDPIEAFLLADLVHVIEQGRLTQVGTPDDIRLRPRTPYVADLAGANLVQGVAADGVVTTQTHALHVADRTISGAVLATIHPRAITVHRERPVGSPRNAWPTRVTLVEHLGDRVRLQVGAPLPLAVEVTPGAIADLGIGAGTPVWVAIKATEIGVTSETG